MKGDDYDFIFCDAFKTPTGFEIIWYERTIGTGRLRFGLRENVVYADTECRPESLVEACIRHVAPQLTTLFCDLENATKRKEARGETALA